MDHDRPDHREDAVQPDHPFEQREGPADVLGSENTRVPLDTPVLRRTDVAEYLAKFEKREAEALAAADAARQAALLDDRSVDDAMQAETDAPVLEAGGAGSEPASDAGDEQAAADVQPELLAASMVRNRRLRQMLADLTDVIDRDPTAFGCYVLRGEAWMKARRYELARADFVRALQLAGDAVTREAWGIVAQVMFDRAVIGKRDAERRLG
jgi:tetratricopeptide (TPR) repeat protein